MGNVLTKRYVCVHGHFYQPPRENPWLEEIEIQESAYPYHDWNERITTECYAPNSSSRILGPQRKITDIVNNYSNISFNFGPTLLFWMERHAPGVYQSIITSDQISRERFSGHGAALAQCYNHVIMPLANSRDKRTQVIWGIRDFEHRFGRKPEGMWLPETAVDLESLNIFAEHGIRFTILAPHQSRRIRKIGEEQWQEALGARIDPKLPYLCRLSSGKSIVIFFYDGPISLDVAFKGLLTSGVFFAERLVSAFGKELNEPNLVHIATDGETYGHHHRHGDMALAYCFHHIEKNKLAEITIYAEFLKNNPPQYEVEIMENSAWSCLHGLERWRSNCGCNSKMRPAWNQLWRAPLRQAIDNLRDALIPLYEREMKTLTDDPWRVRDDYIDVVLNRSKENVERFFKSSLGRDLTAQEKVKALKLLEIERNAMLMYTSCGWFFDEISGIETLQVIQYAARSIQLAQEIAGADLEGEFREALKKAPSNIPELKDGAQIYDMYVHPKIIDLLRVGVHYAISSIFEEYPPTEKIFSFTVTKEKFIRQRNEKQHLVIGKAQVRSSITWEERDVYFAVIYLGKDDLKGGVTAKMSDQDFSFMQKSMEEAFASGEAAKLKDKLKEHFGVEQYSLWHLFKNKQEKVLNQILEPTLNEMKHLFRHIYEHHYPLMQERKDMRISLPKAVASTVEFVLNRDLTEMLSQDHLDLHELQKMVEEVKRWSFELDNASLSFTASLKIADLFQQLDKSPKDISLWDAIETVLRILKTLPLILDRRKAQNIYFSIGKQYLKTMQESSAQGDQEATLWVTKFNAIGEYLQI